MLPRSLYLIAALVLVVPLQARADSLTNLLAASDVLFLNRLTYGVNIPSEQQYQALGRERFIQSQLVFRGDEGLPSDVQHRIAEMDISKFSAAELVAERRKGDEDLRISDSEDKALLRQRLNQRANKLALESSQRRILRGVYSSNQLQELLTWFWFNHFTVFQHKANINLLVADYEEHAIRPYVLGNFRDLLLATLTHPAMLVYLDNARNAAGAVNENYARELMELHTLGVDGGYTQGDVQNLARILTGVGVDFSGRECVKGEKTLGAFSPPGGDGLFCFNLKRHDRNAKQFLGHEFPAGGGAEEVLRAVDILVKEPATARFISRKLAIYLLADDPPKDVVDAMALTFRKTDGNIARTLITLFHSDAFRSGRYLGSKFKDPVHYVISSLRLFSGDIPIENIGVAVNQINQLGEPFYAHVAPDGYGLRKQDWLSADQMTKRFDLSGAISRMSGAGYPDRRTAAIQESAAQATSWQDTDEAYSVLQPILSSRTVSVLERTADRYERNSLLLSAPEFMYR